MTRLTLLVLALASTVGGCLPNPQSEWTSSAGGSQRSTLEDPTILARSTPCPPGGGFIDFDWGYAFSFSASDDDQGDAPRVRERAHVTVDHRFGAMTSSEHRSLGSSSGGTGGSRRR